MSAKSQPEDPRHLSSHDELLDRLNEINGSLQDRIDQDQRFQSGVPDRQRPTDLDFILMSGLTRPAPENILNPADFNAPISFFEQGVADVDDAMAPPDIEPVVDEVIGIEVRGLPPTAIQQPPQIDGNIIEMPVITPQIPEAETAEPVADAAEEKLEGQALSPPPAEQAYDALAAVLQDLPQDYPASEAASPSVELPPVSSQESEEPAGARREPEPEPVAETTPSPETSFADEMTASNDEASFPVYPYLKSARQDLAEPVADSEPSPADVPDAESAPPAAIEEPLSIEPPSADIPDAFPESLQPIVEESMPPKPQPEPMADAFSELPQAVEDFLRPEPVPESLQAIEEFLPPEPQPADIPDAFSESPHAVEEIAYPERQPLDAEPAAAAISGSALPDAEVAGPPDLAEAEIFLRALEDQPRDVIPPIETPEPVSIDPPQEPPDGEEDLPVRESMTRHSARRSRRSHGHTRLRKLRIALAAIVIIAAAAALVGTYSWVRPMFSSPEARLAAAERMAAGGSYAQASAAFNAFATTYPQHAARASAQFMAAHSAAMEPGRDFDEEQAAAKRALVLFETFLRDNPTHAKAPRAWTMVARLHYKLGQYQEAVNILRDPVLQLRDPESALPGLRTLARAYVRLGEHESAVSAYQQAAALAGNYTPDADYEELGDLFKLRADRADDPVEALKLRQAAVENWSYAIRVPGIDFANKAKVQDKIKWLESQIGEQRQPPATPDTAAAAASPEQPATGTAPQDRPSPQPTAVDPAAEARFLGGNPVTDSTQ